MVAKPAAPYRLPASPQSLGRLIESCFSLWMASWRPTFWYSLLYGFASLLPGLTMGDLMSRTLRHGLGIALSARLPWLPLKAPDDPLELARAALDWLCAPQTWALLVASLLLVLVSLTLLIHRQHRVACGDDADWMTATRRGLARVPVSLGAWAVYAALLVAFTLPLPALTIGLFHWGTATDLTGLLALLLAFLLSAALLSVPLAWISVAAGFAPFISTIEGRGPLQAQRESMALVRGHWTHAALIVTLPMLLYLGVGSTLSSIAMLACGGIAFALGGWIAIMDGGWLLWSQIAVAIPMAIALPLASAGGVIGWHDLTLRRQAKARTAVAAG